MLIINYRDTFEYIKKYRRWNVPLRKNHRVKAVLFCRRVEELRGCNWSLDTKIRSRRSRGASKAHFPAFSAASQHNLPLNTSLAFSLRAQLRRTRLDACVSDARNTGHRFITVKCHADRGERVASIGALGSRGGCDATRLDRRSEASIAIASGDPEARSRKREYGTCTLRTPDICFLARGTSCYAFSLLSFFLFYFLAFVFRFRELSRAASPSCRDAAGAATHTDDFKSLIPSSIMTYYCYLSLRIYAHVSTYV